MRAVTSSDKFNGASWGNRHHRRQGRPLASDIGRQVLLSRPGPSYPMGLHHHRMRKVHGGEVRGRACSRVEARGCRVREVHHGPLLLHHVSTAASLPTPVPEGLDAARARCKQIRPILWSHQQPRIRPGQAVRALQGLDRHHLCRDAEALDALGFRRLAAGLRGRHDLRDARRGWRRVWYQPVGRQDGLRRRQAPQGPCEHRVQADSVQTRDGLQGGGHGRPGRGPAQGGRDRGHHAGRD